MNFELRKVYTFTTLAPAILGNTYDNMKVKSILSADEAVIYRDIHTLHTNLKTIIPTLPTVDDCTFILFEKQDESKTTILLALEYIDTFSIQNTVTVNINITILDTSTEMVSVISTRLRELGVNNFTINLA